MAPNDNSLCSAPQCCLSSLASEHLRNGGAIVAGSYRRSRNDAQLYGLNVFLLTHMTQSITAKMALGRQFQGWFKDAGERQEGQTHFFLSESMAAQARRPLETCDNELMTSKRCN